MESSQFKEDRISFVNQSESLISQKMFPEALKFAEDRLAQFPSDIDARVFINLIFIEMGKIEESRKILHELEQDIVTLSFGFLRAANAYHHKGLIQDAVSCYQKFIALNPLAENSQEVAETIVLLQNEENIIDEEPEEDDTEIAQPEFYTMTLADLYIRQGHLKMAADILAEVIKREPANVQAKEKFDTVNAFLAKESLSADNTEAINNLINILSCWLDNIGRLKTHAA
ncbi:MAG: hypothetical protein ABFD57_05540 [Smithella sp.]